MMNKLLLATLLLLTIPNTALANTYETEEEFLKRMELIEKLEKLEKKIDNDLLVQAMRYPKEMKEVLEHKKEFTNDHERISN